jgi:PKHD-type hydroxylase
MLKYFHADGVFTNEELDTLIRVGDEEFHKNFVSGGFGGEGNKKYNRDLNTIRQTNISWLLPSKDTEFAYKKIMHTLGNLNQTEYKFQLTRFADPLQYTVYDGGKGDHYTWHSDGYESNGKAYRKLSAILILSDPSEYEGGDLEVFIEVEPVRIEPIRGRLIVFPSYLLHRVTPVTKGVRKTLVSWISGDSFK